MEKLIFTDLELLDQAKILNFLCFSLEKRLRRVLRDFNLLEALESAIAQNEPCILNYDNIKEGKFIFSVRLIEILEKFIEIWFADKLISTKQRDMLKKLLTNEKILNEVMYEILMKHGEELREVVVNDS